TPIGGFLQAATIGLLPSHLLSEAAVETLADDPFSVQPVGSGPFVLTSWNADSATLSPPSAALPRAGEPVSPEPGSSETPIDGQIDAPSASPVDVPPPSPAAGGSAAAPDSVRREP